MLAAWGVTCAAALVPQPLARTAAGLSRRAAPALMGADDSAFTLAILGDLHLDPRDLGTPAPGQPVRWVHPRLASPCAGTYSQHD